MSNQSSVAEGFWNTLTPKDRAQYVGHLRNSDRPTAIIILRNWDELLKEEQNQLIPLLVKTEA